MESWAILLAVVALLTIVGVVAVRARS